MSSLEELTAQRADLDRQIAAQKPEAIAEIKARMLALGVTTADLSPAPAQRSKRPIKYRDDAGNTWTGIGQRPRWLRAAVLAGAALDSFRIPG